ncbi:hypothetical protein V2A60_004419 [Cordyceps javanica]
MLSPTVTCFCLISLVSASAVLPRAACGEGSQKICYGVGGGQSQDLDPEDVQYAIDCAEWSLPVANAGTVLALAKHINNREKSSILYEDLAAAIDGGKNSADKGQNGKNGGQMGVTANTSNPLYNTDEYDKSGAKPDGIIIKLVKAPSS